MNRDNIAVRAGNHCAMPLHNKFGIPGSTRASFYIYNTKEDVDKLIEGLKKVKVISSNKKIIRDEIKIEKL